MRALLSPTIITQISTRLEEEDISGGFWFFIIGYNMRTNTAVCFSRSKCAWHFLRITKISHFFPFIWSKHLKIITKYTIPSRYSSDIYQAWATRMTDFGNAMESVLCQLKSVCVYVPQKYLVGKDMFASSRFFHTLPKTNFSWFHFLLLQDYSLAVKILQNFLRNRHVSWSLAAWNIFISYCLQICPEAWIGLSLCLKRHQELSTSLWDSKMCSFA